MRLMVVVPPQQKMIRNHVVSSVSKFVLRRLVKGITEGWKPIPQAQTQWKLNDGEWQDGAPLSVGPGDRIGIKVLGKGYSMAEQTAIGRFQE